jgi:hypothetical protein
MVAAVRMRTPSAWRDEDFLPQLFSWIFALGVGAAWLLIVYLSAAPVDHSDLAVPEPLSIGFTPRTPPASTQPAQRTAGSAAPPTVGRSRATAPHSALDAATLFAAAAATGAVAHISQFIPGAIAVRGDVGAATAGSKSALSTSGAESTPGMAQLSQGNSTAGASVGAVERRASIDRANMHVQSLPVVRAAPLGIETADATEMGTFVRGRVAQLQSCYERLGGTDLAGVVALRLEMGGSGIVRRAEIVRRSWSGPSAAATEACLLNIVRAWRMPFAADGSAITIPISFTRGT